MKTKQTMSLRTMFWIFSLGLFLFFLIATTLMVNRFMLQHIQADTEARAHRILDRNLAIHSYLSEEFKSTGSAITDDCMPNRYVEPEWMPSSSRIERISKQLNGFKTEDYYYKEAAINARAPRNEADSLEKAFIGKLRNDPNLTMKSGLVTIDKKPFFYLLHRGEKMKQGCMRCHGNPDNAPEELLKIYGPKKGFHKNMAETVSAISIRVPMGKEYMAAQRFTIEFVFILISVFAFVLVVAMIVVNRMLLLPIEKLRDMAKQISSDETELGKNISLPTGRELKELTSTFNSMSSRLADTMASLENKVEERTHELSVSNANLEKEILNRISIEDELAAQRKKYMDILEYMPAFVCIVDIKHNIRYSNRYFREYFGGSENRKCYQATGNREQPCENCGIEDVIKSGQTVSSEFIHSGGRTYLINSVPHNEDGTEIMALQIGIDISKQKKAEEQVVIFKKLVEASSQGLVIFSETGEIVYLNPKLLKMLEEKYQDNLTGKPIFDFYPSVMQSWLKKQIIPEVLEKGEWSGELALIPKKGQVIPTYNHVFLMEDAVGESARIAAIITDITESRLSAEIIRQREEQYRILVESIKEGIWVFDRQGKTVFANGMMTKMLLLNPTEINGRSLGEFLREEDQSVLSRLFNVSPAEARGSHEIELLKSNGESIWVHISVSPIIDELGEYDGAIAGVLDITDRIKMQENVMRQTAVLSCINSILQETIKTESEEEVAEKCLEEAMSLTGSEMGFIGELNSNGKLDVIGILFPGMDKRELLDKYKGRISNMEIKGVWGNIINNKKSVIINDLASCPEKIRLPELHPEINRFMGTPLRNKDEIIGIIALANKNGEYNVMDSAAIESISAVFVEALRRKRANIRNIELMEELQQAQKMEAVGLLAGGIAHDFNNLLTRIMGNSDLLLANMKPDEKGYAEIESILAASEEARELTMKILSFARRDKLNIKIISPNEIVRNGVNILGKGMMGKAVIITDLDESVAPIKVDLNQIQQVLMNICSNAYDAMSYGGTLRIRTYNEKSVVVNERKTDALTPGFYSVIEVSDTGPGIPEKIMDRIFDPFFTTKGLGEGSGLGLSVSHGIITNHGGAIRVSSAPGQGTKVKIYLPAVDADNEDGANNRTSKSENKKTVLLIDDDEAILETAEIMLMDNGFGVITSDSGMDALKKYAQAWKTINLVLLDMIMPGFSGQDVFREIIKINPAAKVILVSGYSKDGAASEILKNGAVGFLQKPFRIKELVNMATAVMAQ